MILKRVENYCTPILEEIKINLLPFHNIHHTRAVVFHVKEVCKHLSLSKADMEPIIIAAWFHDIGHIITYQDHEKASIQMAQAFLTKENLDQKSIDIINSCIQATRLIHHPESYQAKILCDADLYHLGSLEYFYWQILLRREWEVSLNKTYDDKEWHKLNHKFLSDHTYYTKYGKDVISIGQRENISKIERLLLVYS